ncbi:zinc ABC transporter substrate-binding protein [Geitlerinema sp. PCC 9228]|jgi:zinc transport system substrate-binding protein|uniref:metal ABC transporter solute-binding protein, Zn/Mn family n=1 Tax=Geitlerinema sp. PCC 9228 TaxID=111611 RepID=UPI0008F989A8|nr:zinc ABC transporter substrate-binding protein [Geitlerinema sp. PCC 9228]
MKLPLFPTFLSVLLGSISLMGIAGCGSNSNVANDATTTSETAQPAAESEPSVTDTMQIAVSILPQKYFVKRIGGDTTNVTVMVPPDASPATYEPKPNQLQSLSQAAVYFRIGVPFENAWMEKMTAANTDMSVVDTRQGIDLRPMNAHHHHNGHHHHTNNGGAESMENPDPHIWLSPQRVKVQAQTIYETLAKMNPENRNTYKENLDEFLADIEELDGYIQEKLSGLENRKFMVFHPSWGYFAADYNLEMIPIEVGGQEPSASEMAALVKTAKQENIKVVFAQPQFNTKDAQTIAQEINGQVVSLDPLAPNWSENLRKAADTFAEVLK